MSIHSHINKYIMFILRKIVGSGIQANICLNKVYNVVDAESSPDEFLRALRIFRCLPEDHNFMDNPINEDDGKIYAFIVYNEGSSYMPLYKAQNNYIMTSDGKTFDNLTCREYRY